MEDITNKPVQSLDAASLQARRMMEDATRLAAKGQYRCRVCGVVDKQENGVIVAFAGNILLALCPGCIKGPIMISRNSRGIMVQMANPKKSNIVLASDLSNVERHLKVAKPKVTKVKL